MLVYRGMDIGTAKPSRAEREKIPHHLIDVLSSGSNFSVYAYRREALRAVHKILKRGKIPLVVGGSGLYLNTLWKGLSGQPGGNEKLRRELNREAGEKGLSYLYERLRKIDPRRATQIHPNDRRRILRALEITELSGRTSSEWFRERESLEDLGYSVRLFGIRRERSDLYERLNRRVEQMFRKGFVREVSRLRRSGFSKTARQALGYREILEHLKERRRADEIQGLIQKIQKRTRQFAKRQLTWFRREKEIEWLDWKKGETAAKVCGQIAAQVKDWIGS